MKTSQERALTWKSLISLMQRVADSEPAPIGVVRQAKSAADYALRAGLIELRDVNVEAVGEDGSYSRMAPRMFITSSGRDFLLQVSGGRLLTE